MNGSKSSVIATVFNQKNIFVDLLSGSESYNSMIYVNQEEEAIYFNSGFNSINEIEFKITNELNMAVVNALFKDWLIQLTFYCFNEKNNVIK